MRAYESLREIVRGAGGVLIEEHLNPQAFGSAYAVFAGRTGEKFRLVWDGKESYGFLQTPVAPTDWRDIGPIVKERFGGKFSQMSEFLATAECLSAGGSLIYIALLGDGTAVWRPVAATPVSNNVFRLHGPVPVGESWQFPPDSFVRCEPHVFSSGEHGLVAVEVANA